MFKWNFYVKVPFIFFLKNIFSGEYFVTKSTNKAEGLSVMEDARSNSQFMTHAPIPPSIYIAYHDTWTFSKYLPRLPLAIIFINLRCFWEVTLKRLFFPVFKVLTAKVLVSLQSVTGFRTVRRKVNFSGKKLLAD